MTTATTFITTTESRLNLLPIKSGQLIFVRDSKRICLDYNGVRTEYGQIIILENENHRLSIDSPFNTFYYVLETNVLWRYNEKWISLTGSNTSVKEEIVFIENENELPEEGKVNILYSTLTAIYRWDGSQYVKSGTLFWEEF